MPAHMADGAAARAHEAEHNEDDGLHGSGCSSVAAAHSRAASSSAAVAAHSGAHDGDSPAAATAESAAVPHARIPSSAAAAAMDSLEPTPLASLPPCFAPLLHLYTRRSLPAPKVTLLSHPAEQLPPQYARLLHHGNNMTPTLSSFWCDQTVHLRVLEKEELRSPAAAAADEQGDDAHAGTLSRWITLHVDEPVHVHSRPEDKAALQQRREEARAERARISSAQNAVSVASATAASPNGLLAPPGIVPARAAPSSSSPTPLSPPISPPPQQCTPAPSPSPAPAASSGSSPSPSAPPRPLVEFGSIRIHLGSLPCSLRESIWLGAKPFATLLLEHKPRPVLQRIKPQCFFAIRWDQTIRSIVGSGAEAGAAASAAADAKQEEDPIVYGRCNYIFAPNHGEGEGENEHASERLICEVVEIMPPIRIDS